MSRRGFLQAVVGGLGIVLLAGCAGSNSSGGETAAGPAQVEAVPKGNELQIPGAGKLKNGEGLAYVLNGDIHGIVFRTKEGELKAVSAHCTHAGGTLEWQGTQLHCPVHGSNFDINGKVVSGPANKPLAFYKVKRQGDDALVRTT